jgi:predicted ester cyclase
MNFGCLIERFYLELTRAGVDGINSVAEQYLAADVKWCVAHPVNDLSGRAQVIEQFLKPLLNALPDLERNPIIVLSDLHECSTSEENVTENGEGKYWVDGTGYFVGTFANRLFDIPATKRSLYLRYTEMVRIENGKIKECYLIPDFIDAMNQAGVNPLRDSLGHAGPILAPATQDGLRQFKHSAPESNKSRQLVLDMLDCLGRYDGKDLKSMDLENYWHSNFMWYGPGGVGTTRGIDGFRAHHQGPFVHSFPDRSVDTKINFIANDNYAATGGWPHMSGTHSVGGWLGLPPSGKKLSLRVMDIWRREDDLLKENWVAIDIIDMLMQMGLDVFAQMRELNE